MLIPKILTEHKDAIKRINVRTHKINIPADRWINRLNETYPKLKLPQNISRDDLFKKSPEFPTSFLQNAPCPASTLKELFAWVMIWGYATDSRGPHRVDGMLRTPDLTEILCEVEEALHYGLHIKGYNLIKKITNVNASLASKYLNFRCYNNTPTIKPLIFDNRVVESLIKILPNKQSHYFHTTYQGKANRKHQDNIYGQYIILTNNWAHALKCEADQIEYFLWNKLHP